MNAAAFRASFDASEVANIWPAPDMSILTGGRTKPPALPAELFGPIWPLIGALAEGAGAPVDYVAMGVLSVAASLIGGKRRVQPYATSNQWVDPCILWVALVGDPSSNKSPAIDAATGPLRQMESDHAELHKNMMMSFETRAERAKAERSRWQKAVEVATKDAIGTPPMPEAAVAPEEPQRRRLLVQDATPEALGAILAGNPSGTLHLRDELAGWLTSFDRYSPGGREFWLEAYGGRQHVIDRKGSKVALRIPFNGVSVLGGIQPEKLADCLLGGADDGLVARFLWAWPDPVPYHRPRQIADVGRLEQVYRRLDSLRPNYGPDGEQAPRVLVLDPAAADIFEAWVREHSEGIGETASLYKGFCGKLKGAVLRVALVAELIAWADGSSRDEPATIRPATIVAAIEFAESYAKPTALRVFGDAALPPVERDAAAVARMIRKTAAQQVNARDLRRSSGIPSLKLPGAMDDALAHLMEADWLKQIERPGDAVGRGRKDYLVNPAVHGPEA